MDTGYGTPLSDASHPSPPSFSLRPAYGALPSMVPSNHDRLDEKAKVSPLALRGARYKEKFQALREKYDQVIAIHDEYQRELELANSRTKKLQAENDLLLDALHLAYTSRPSMPQSSHVDDHSAPTHTNTSFHSRTTHDHPLQQNGANGRHRYSAEPTDQAPPLPESKTQDANGRGP